jgi:hypothetical protein
MKLIISVLKKLMENKQYLRLIIFISLINSHIPNNSIAAGIPAKIVKKNETWVKERFSSEL